MESPNPNPSQQSLQDAISASRAAKPQYKIPPEGDYIVDIEGARPCLSQKGKPQSELTLEIISADDPQWAGSTILDWIQTQGKGVFRLCDICDALGLDDRMFIKPADISRHLSGLEIGITIHHVPDLKGINRARVKAYWNSNKEGQDDIVADLNAKLPPKPPEAAAAAAPEPVEPQQPDSEPGPELPLDSDIAKRKAEGAKRLSELAERIRKQQGKTSAR
jgi:hypothetical protein